MRTAQTAEDIKRILRSIDIRLRATEKENERIARDLEKVSDKLARAVENAETIQWKSEDAEKDLKKFKQEIESIKAQQRRGSGGK